MEGYWANVGQVFLGYADALNPVNAIVGAYGAGCSFFKGNSEGDSLIGHRLSGAMATELVGGIFQLDDPRRFGSSFMGALLTVAPIMKGIRAPNVGGMGIAPEVATAARTATSTRPVTITYHPRTRVPFIDGFPDFSDWAVVDVEIKPTGSR